LSKTGRDVSIGCLRLKSVIDYGSEDEYQLREGQTDYGGGQDLDNENTFDWNLAN
jgi:hypothetical protein